MTEYKTISKENYEELKPFLNTMIAFKVISFEPYEYFTHQRYSISGLTTDGIAYAYLRRVRIYRTRSSESQVTLRLDLIINKGSRTIPRYREINEETLGGCKLLVRRVTDRERIVVKSAVSLGLAEMAYVDDKSVESRLNG